MPVSSQSSHPHVAEVLCPWSSFSSPSLWLLTRLRPRLMERSSQGSRADCRARRRARAPRDPRAHLVLPPRAVRPRPRRPGRRAHGRRLRRVPPARAALRALAAPRRVARLPAVGRLRARPVDPLPRARRGPQPALQRQRRAAPRPAHRPSAGRRPARPRDLASPRRPARDPMLVPIVSAVAPLRSPTVAPCPHIRPA